MRRETVLRLIANLALMMLPAGVAAIWSYGMPVVRHWFPDQVRDVTVAATFASTLLFLWLAIYGWRATILYRRFLVAALYLLFLILVALYLILLEDFQRGSFRLGVAGHFPGPPGGDAV
jgi:hypothetical protein